MSIKRFLLAVLLASSSLQALASDQYYQVDYGVVEDATQQDKKWYQSASTGYTVKLSDNPQLIRLVSKVPDILVGDCVAIDRNKDGASIRRVNNSKCTKNSDVLSSKQPHLIRQNSAHEKTESLVSHSCQNARKKVENLPAGPSRFKAIKQAAKACRG